MSKNKVLLMVFAIVSICGCSAQGTFCVDINQQAIVSCDRTTLKKLEISNQTETIILEGTEAIVYFNKINNVAKTQISDSVVYDYKFILRPKSNYKIRASIGYDRPEWEVTFATDSFGNVISSSYPNCNH